MTKSDVGTSARGIRAVRTRFHHGACKLVFLDVGREDLERPVLGEAWILLVRPRRPTILSKIIVSTTTRTGGVTSTRLRGDVSAQPRAIGSYPAYATPSR